MKFLITNDNNQSADLNAKQFHDIKIYYSDDSITWENENGSFILVGSIIGIRNDNGSINDNATKEEVINLCKDISNIDLIEGRFACINVDNANNLSILTDRFGRFDVYINESENNIYISSGLDLLPISSESNSHIDNIGLMQAVYIYGSRPIKKHTSFKNISRLGVSEKITFNDNGLKISKILRNINKDFKYKNEEEGLNDYADRFIESIRANGSENGNVVFLSSGWDSTSILATLVHVFGKDKTRAVIGEMRYSDRSGVANTFEMERAKKMADYYDIRLDVVKLDYTQNAEQLFTKVRKTFQSQQFANLTGFNHWMLAEHAEKTSNTSKKEVVFAGEMSDGAHNFGFSQYVSIFHPDSYDFREYSDKMGTYLFGPTFLNALIDKRHENDPVWNLFKSSKSNDFFEPIANDERSIKEQFLKSFFLRSGRMPLAKNNSNLLNDFGKKELDRVSTDVYLKDYIDNLSKENLYASYLDLYNSFHWQGGTVATLYHVCEAHNLKCALPFHDSSLIDFLSQMPESWGRGLEMKPTKYPLKWMLSNRIDYPMELQQGAHSYTYDVDPSFTHIGELLNHSSLKNVFLDSLKNTNLEKLFSSEYFNLDYINDLVDRYQDGEEICVAEQGDLLNISMQTILGPNIS